jgi:hypothetical protein
MAKRGQIHDTVATVQNAKDPNPSNARPGSVSTVAAEVVARVI